MYWHIFIVRYLFVLYSLSFIVCILMQLTLSVVHVLWYMRWLGKTGDLYISLVVWSNFFHRSLDDEHHIFGRSELCTRAKNKKRHCIIMLKHILHTWTLFSNNMILWFVQKSFILFNHRKLWHKNKSYITIACIWKYYRGS